MIVRADGDAGGAIAAAGLRYRAEIGYGEWLFHIEHGGEIADEMLRLFLRDPTR